MPDLYAFVPRVPVTFQMCINCHPDEYHLFEMDYDELPQVYPGMKLIAVPGVPNVVGQVADFDNAITALAYDGSTRRMKAQVHGARYKTDTLDEVKKDLPEWKHIRQIPNGLVKDEQRFDKPA